MKILVELPVEVNTAKCDVMMGQNLEVYARKVSDVVGEAENGARYLLKAYICEICGTYFIGEPLDHLKEHGIVTCLARGVGLITEPPIVNVSPY